jgi:hypothetical protein
VSSSATNQQGNEAAIFKAVLGHSIALALLVGLIVMLYAYAIPWIIPALVPELGITSLSLRAPWPQIGGDATQAMLIHRQGAANIEMGPCRRNAPARKGPIANYRHPTSASPPSLLAKKPSP